MTATDTAGQAVVILFAAGTEKVTDTLPSANFANVTLAHFVPLVTGRGASEDYV